MRPSLVQSPDSKHATRHSVNVQQVEGVGLRVKGMSTYADSKHGNKHEKSSSPVNMLEFHKQIKSVNMKNITAASMLQPHQKSKSVNMKNITAASMLQTHQRTYPEPFRFPVQAERIKSVNMKNMTAASMLQPHQKSKSVNMKDITAASMLQTHQRTYIP